MATTRTLLDDRGQSILDLFVDNMETLGDINMSVANGSQWGRYDGSWGEVNINWPNQKEADNWRHRVEPGHEYKVREVTLFEKNNPLTEEEHKVIGNVNSSLATSRSIDLTLNITNGEDGGVKMDKHAGRSNRLDKILNAVPSGSNLYETQDNFMKLKGRKGLYTLLQETWSAFFDGDDNPVYRRTDPVQGAGGYAGMSSISNQYSDGVQSYDFKYLSNQGASFIDPPDGSDFANQALHGYVLGQLYGGEDQDIVSRVRTEAQNITREYFSEAAAAAGEAGDDILKNYYNSLIQIMAPATRVSQLYVPGWSRPAENYLTRKPISELLNQNLLLPPSTDSSIVFSNPLSMPGNDNGNGEGVAGHGDTNATFQSLYTRNRAGDAGVGANNIQNPLFNNGKLAGTSLNALQEPKGITSKHISGEVNPPSETTVPFSFKDDDARYLTFDRLQTGYQSNGPNTNTQPSKAEPAVKDYKAGATVADDAATVIKLGQGQRFPFTFSTINKTDTAGNKRLQVCFLQAIINSMSESYNPTWQSKHFFGRTEQAHTYTFTDRTVDLSFTIYADEMRLLQNVYERVLWLAQQCYPDFDNSGRLLQGPIIALRIGDIFQHKAGIIRSLSYDWFFAGGKWESTAGMRMPQGCTVTMSYQIIHNAMPTRDTDLYGGQAGGLNAATERSRTLRGHMYNEDGIFEAWDDSVDEFGYGDRLIDSGALNQNNEEKAYLETIKAINYSAAGTISAEDLSENRETLLQVPVGIADDGDPEYAR